MNGSEKGTVQPTTTLRDEFGNLGPTEIVLAYYSGPLCFGINSTYSCRDISGGFRTLHISQTRRFISLSKFRLFISEKNLHPSFALLSDNLEAKNTILGEVHVPLYRPKTVH